MIRLLVRLVLLILPPLLGTLAVIRAQPYDDDNLRALFDSGLGTGMSAGDNCAAPKPAPCLLGIQPGVTDLTTVETLLEAHPWIGVIRYARGMAMNSGFLLWTWSGAQPAFIDGGVDGKLWIQNGRVQWLEVATRYRFGDLWLINSPQNGRIYPQSVEPRQVSQQLDYDRIVARSEAPCPLSPETFWRARLVFRLLDEAPDVSPGYALPRWRGCS